MGPGGPVGGAAGGDEVGSGVAVGAGVGLGLGLDVSAGAAEAALTGTGWIDTYRPSQIIGNGAYRHGVKNRFNCATVSDVPGFMS